MARTLTTTEMLIVIVRAKMAIVDARYPSRPEGPCAAFARRERLQMALSVLVCDGLHNLTLEGAAVIAD